MPVPHLKPGDKVRCDVCGRKVYLTAAPAERSRDPWRGSNAPRISPHWSNPMKEAEPGN